MGDLTMGRHVMKKSSWLAGSTIIDRTGVGGMPGIIIRIDFVTGPDSSIFSISVFLPFLAVRDQDIK